jgi:hypothetical protein
VYDDDGKEEGWIEIGEDKLNSNEDPHNFQKIAMRYQVNDLPEFETFIKEVERQRKAGLLKFET